MTIAHGARVLPLHAAARRVPLEFIGCSPGPQLFRGVRIDVDFVGGDATSVGLGETRFELTPFNRAGTAAAPVAATLLGIGAQAKALLAVARVCLRVANMVTIVTLLGERIR